MNTAIILCVFKSRMITHAILIQYILMWALKHHYLNLLVDMDDVIKTIYLLSQLIATFIFLYILTQTIGDDKSGVVIS